MAKPAQAGRDRAVRRLTPNVSEQLRAAIAKDGRSIRALAADARVTHQQIGRFLSHERDISLATAAKLAEALGLSLRRTL